MTNSGEGQFTQVAITDPFWNKYQQLITKVVIPYQWEALNDQLPDTEPSHAIENLKIAAGELTGEFYGMVFQDSDVAKWLEAVAYSLAKTPDPQLESLADEVIDLIGRAQQQDGYINSYFTVKEPLGRWSNLSECHELYCAGHLIEAGVAYYCATGKNNLLSRVKRFADYIDNVFGPNADQLKGYPGHPEIELALMRLYEVTGEIRYQQLARFFIEQRGQLPHYYEEEFKLRGQTSYWDPHSAKPRMVYDKSYSQAHQPLAEQQYAVGHAVRFAYLMTGVAHLARVSGDAEKLAICKRLWRDMVDRQMYITGAIGSQSNGEAFSCDFDLPNDSAYTETCASIGLIMFARRMLELETDSSYADVMERALYNTVLAGMALDGRHFFYVNPLEVDPKAIAANHIYDHVKPERQPWFGCACCPPNLARLVGSLGNYIYTVKKSVVLVNLFIAAKSTLHTREGTLVITQSGNFPWQSNIEFKIDEAPEHPITIALRVPQWCERPTLTINGEELNIEAHLEQGYVQLTRHWQSGDSLHFTLPMPLRFVRADPRLRQDIGQIAVQRGPLIYCLEEVDNGANLGQLYLSTQSNFAEIAGRDVLAGTTLLTTSGARLEGSDDHQGLYQYVTRPPKFRPQELTFIPYFCWANRGVGEMRVWLKEKM